jgi:pimeloyl-ACP methyl ester carboxylesterase
MAIIPTKRGNIHFEQSTAVSNAPVLMLIHGAGGTHLDWPESIRQLSNVDVIALDLPGHGGSAGSGHDSLNAFAADVIALLDALEIERAIFAGHSMGGGIALTLALEYPSRTLGLILVGTGAKLSVHPDILDNLISDRQRVTQMLVDWFWSPDADPAMKQANYDHLMRINPHTFHADFAACNTFDVRERLSEIQTPTLIIAGTDDKMTPHKFAVYLHNQITNSRLQTIEDGSHKFLLEKPAIIRQILINWIDQIT